MPKTVQLRRYDLKPDLVDEFLAWWPSRLVPARRAHGFEIEFAYLNRSTNEFTWAVSVEGDAEQFAAVESGYITSPERDAAFAGVTGWTDSAVVSIVDAIDPEA
ncbi:MAG: hypothetical protein ABWY36_06660 [Leifsonia sp.]